MEIKHTACVVILLQCFTVHLYLFTLEYWWKINSYNDAIIELWINLIFDLWKLFKGLNIFIITFAYFPRVDVRFVYYSLFINIIISRNIFIHFFICFFIRIFFSLALISHWILALYVVFVTSQTEIKSLIIMIITIIIIIIIIIIMIKIEK